MEERDRALRPKRVEPLLECAKRALQRHWRSTAAILFASDIDQHVEQVLGCAIVGATEKLEAQRVGHGDASLAV